jgi:ribosomal RNA-processing protein 9
VGGSETDEFGVPITRRRRNKMKSKPGDAGGNDDDDDDDLSDRETAGEKRVRLAKAMLARYTQEERQSAAAAAAAGGGAGGGAGSDHGGEDEDEDDWKTERDSSQRGITGERDDVAITQAVSQRLYDDVREAKGKLYRECAEVLLTCDAADVSNAFHRGHDKAPTCVCISHDERSAWTGSKDCSIVRWDVETGKRVSRYQGGHVTKMDRKRGGGKAIQTAGHSDEVLAVACTTDGRYLASAGRDAMIRLWDTRTDQQLDTFKGHRDIVSCLSFQDYSHTLYSGSHDRTVKIWNMTERMYVDTLFGHQAEVVAVSCLRKERAVR